MPLMGHDGHYIRKERQQGIEDTKGAWAWVQLGICAFAHKLFFVVLLLILVRGRRSTAWLIAHILRLEFTLLWFCHQRHQVQK